MTIRYRLILSYIAMIFVPIILFLAAVMLMVILFLGDIREVSKLLPSNHQYHKVVQPDQQLLMELKEQSIFDPTELVQKDYLNSFESRLVELDSSIILRKNEEIFYSSEETKHLQASILPAFGSLSTNNNIEKIGSETYSIKQLDFYLPDRSKASLFLLKDASPVVKFTRTFFPLLLAMLILILIFTNGLLTYYVSKSIIKPINSLKDAAEKIGQGQLDDPLVVKGKDEISQLTHSFEEMRKQLKSSTEMQKQYEINRKELIAHISHDLKTPITAIKGYVEGIRDGVANTADKQERYLQTIYQKSVDLDHLIDELFLYSKLDLKKLPFHFIILNLKSYLVDFVEELSFELEKRNIQLSFHYDEQMSYFIKADQEKLRRVFSNIMDNSLKYMDKESGEIAISLVAKKEQIIVSIHDNGPGIPEASLPYVFDQFFRAEQSRNKLTGGSGLGLSIAKMIIAEHSGDITANSQPGAGTTISIIFPKEWVQS
jgi:histidine kinase